MGRYFPDKVLRKWAEAIQPGALHWWDQEELGPCQKPLYSPDSHCNQLMMPTPQSHTKSWQDVLS